MLNKVILMGRLTKDPELKKTASDISVCSFTLAVDRNFKNNGEKQTDFINCVAWRNTADFLTKYFTKGQMMALSGSIQTRNWDDQEGKKHYVTEVVADEVFFADSKRESGTAPKDKEPAGKSADDFDIVPDDEELPF